MMPHGLKFKDCLLDNYEAINNNLLIIKKRNLNCAFFIIKIDEN